MILQAVEDTWTFYENLWADLNGIGHIVLFPVLLFVSPIVFVVLLCVGK